MGILDRFYLLLGNGDIMRGTKVFDICLAGVFVLIVIIAAICIVIGIRNDRKVKDVSLTSDKAKKARERQLRSVFNESLDNGTVIPAPAGETGDDGDEGPKRSRRMHVNRRAIINDVRRGHGDIPGSDEDKAPKVALKRSEQRPPDDIAQDGHDDGGGPEREQPADMVRDRTDAATEKEAVMRQRRPFGDAGRGQDDDGADTLRHARHAKPAAGKNPFSRPIGIKDIKERR